MSKHNVKLTHSFEDHGFIDFYSKSEHLKDYSYPDFDDGPVYEKAVVGASLWFVDKRTKHLVSVSVREVFDDGRFSFYYRGRYYTVDAELFETRLFTRPVDALKKAEKDGLR